MNANQWKNLFKSSVEKTTEIVLMDHLKSALQSLRSERKDLGEIADHAEKELAEMRRALYAIDRQIDCAQQFANWETVDNELPL